MNPNRLPPIAVCASAVAVVVTMSILSASRQTPVARTVMDQLTEDVARRTIFQEDHANSIRYDELSKFIGNRKLSNETRRLSAMALARMGDDAAHLAVPALIDQLQQNEPASIQWSAKALGIFGPAAAEAAPELIRLLDHSESGPRHAAIEALAQIGAAHPQVIPALRDRVTAWHAKSTPEYRVSVEYLLDGIGMIGPVAASCIPFMLRTIESPDSRIRLAVVTALGKMGPRADNSIPALGERLAWDDAPEVREQAALSLANIGEAAIPQLMGLLASDAAETRIAVLHAVGSIGIPARNELPTLIAHTEHQHGAVRLAAAKAVHQVSAGGIDVSPIVLRCLSDEDRQTRMTAVRLFSEIGPHGRTPTVRKLLEQLAASSNPHARQAASKVLRNLFER